MRLPVRLVLRAQPRALRSSSTHCPPTQLSMLPTLFLDDHFLLGSSASSSHGVGFCRRPGQGVCTDPFLCFPLVTVWGLLRALCSGLPAAQPPTVGRTALPLVSPQPPWPHLGLRAPGIFRHHFHCSYSDFSGSRPQGLFDGSASFMPGEKPSCSCDFLLRGHLPVLF